MKLGNIFRRLTNKFKPKAPYSKLIPVNKKLIEKAFAINGVQYWKFTNPLDMPIARWHFAQIFENEKTMSIDRDALLILTQQIIDNTNDGNLVKAAALAWELQYRATEIYDMELVYKLASVVYFDDKEDVSGYDGDYNTAKIANFRSIKPADFFLLTPIKQLLPLGISSEDDMQDFLRVNQAKMSLHKKRLQALYQRP